MAALLLFAGVASADCTIHLPLLDAFHATAALEQDAHEDDSPGDEDCLPSPVLSCLECSARDAAWSAPALLAVLPPSLAFVSTGVAAAPLAEALLPPLPEPVFRRFPRLLI